MSLVHYETYNHLPKTKCQVCSLKTEDQLTLHHIVPREVLERKKVYYVPASLFACLCKRCHRHYHHTDTMSDTLHNLVPKYSHVKKLYHSWTRFRAGDELKNTGWITAFALWFNKDIKEAKDLPSDFGHIPSGIDSIPYDELRVLYQNHFKQWKRELQTVYKFKTGKYND